MVVNIEIKTFFLLVLRTGSEVGILPSSTDSKTSSWQSAIHVVSERAQMLYVHVAWQRTKTLPKNPRMFSLEIRYKNLGCLLSIICEANLSINLASRQSLTTTQPEGGSAAVPETGKLSRKKKKTLHISGHKWNNFWEHGNVAFTNPASLFWSRLPLHPPPHEINGRFHRRFVPKKFSILSLFAKTWITHGCRKSPNSRCEDLESARSSQVLRSTCRFIATW